MRTQAKSSPKRTGVLGILNGGSRIRSGRQYMLAKVGLGLRGGGEGPLGANSGDEKYFPNDCFRPQGRGDNSVLFSVHL